MTCDKCQQVCFEVQKNIYPMLIKIRTSFEMILQWSDAHDREIITKKNEYKYKETKIL